MISPGGFCHEDDTLNTIRSLLWTAVIPLFQLQMKVPDHFFDAPVGPIACRTLEITAADSAASVLEFIDGEVNARETLAAFDSAGVPLYMTVQMTESTPPVEVSHNVVVRFRGMGEYLRIEKPFKDGKFVEDGARIMNAPLTADEMTRSEQLAVWLWDHRCNR